MNNNSDEYGIQDRSSSKAKYAHKLKVIKENNSRKIELMKLKYQNIDKEMSLIDKQIELINKSN